MLREARSRSHALATSLYDLSCARGSYLEDYSFLMIVEMQGKYVEIYIENVASTKSLKEEYTQELR